MRPEQSDRGMQFFLAATLVLKHAVLSRFLSCSISARAGMNKAAAMARKSLPQPLSKDI